MARKPVTYERLLKRDRKYKAIRFLFTIILLAAGVLFIRHADARLSEYEFNQPVNVMKRFLTSLKDGSALKGVSHSLNEESSETLSSLTALSREQALTFKETIQSEKDEHHYKLFSGSETVATVVLKERKALAGENYSRWEVSGVELIVSAERVALDLLKTFQAKDFSYIVENTDPSLYPNETKEDLKNYLLSHSEGKAISLSEGDRSTDDRKEFIYLLDGEPFFTVFVEKDASQSTLWRFSESEVHFIRYTRYTASIPAGTVLYVNGAPAPDSWIKDTTKSAHADRVSSSVINPVDLSTLHYEIDFAFTAPAFSLKDSMGDDLSFSLDDTSLTYSSHQAKIVPEFAFLEASILEATGKIANFFVGEAELRHVMKYVEKDSNAYAIIEEYNLWKSLNAGSTKMESCEISQMTKLGDNCFVVEVSGLFRAFYTTTNVIDYPLDYTLYYHLVDSNWLIYDFISK